MFYEMRGAFYGMLRDLCGVLCRNMLERACRLLVINKISWIFDGCIQNERITGRPG